MNVMDLDSCQQLSQAKARYRRLMNTHLLME